MVTTVVKHAVVTVTLPIQKAATIKMFEGKSHVAQSNSYPYPISNESNPPIPKTGSRFGFSIHLEKLKFLYYHYLPE